MAFNIMADNSRICKYAIIMIRYDEECIMNRLTRLMLERRSWKPEWIQEINCPVHQPLEHLDGVCETLRNIRDNQEKIVVLPDFDTDGIMSGVLGTAGLGELGFNVGLFVPDPHNGYGFNAAEIKRLLQDHPDTKWILTCDVGITCFEGIQYAASQGVQVIVTDHHPASQDKFGNLNLPEALWVVDPMIDDYEHKSICGAYVLWQTLYHFARMYGTSQQIQNIENLRVFAGIATISDMMELTYENRDLVRDAIRICRILDACIVPECSELMYGSMYYSSAMRGLHTLLQTLRQNKKIRHPEYDIHEDLFGFYISPAFNAIKRTDTDLRCAFNVFFSNEQAPASRNLISINEQRKSLEKIYFDKLSEDEQPYAPLIYLSEAPGGILGLLAGRLCAESGLPVVVLNKETLGGSGRSPEWFPFRKMMEPTGVFTGGHQGAFGIRFEPSDSLSGFKKELQKKIRETIQNLPQEMFRPKVYDFTISTMQDGDVALDLPAFSEFLDDMEHLAPFGRGFEKPNQLFRFMPNHATITQIGKKRQHIKCSFPYGFNLFLWNQGGLYEELCNAEYIEVDGQLQRSCYMDEVSVSFTGSVVSKNRQAPVWRIQ